MVNFPGQNLSQSGPFRDGAFTGADAPNEYGDVVVEVVVSNGKISDIKALALPSDRERSIQLSAYVAPLLHDEVLTAQNAQIDMVSGATLTSNSYAESVQSALDQAKP
jgi:uncharacterized protein with FMN-binding domain